MKKVDAGKCARKWVHMHAGDLPGLAGAYISGSYLAAPADAPWPASSDVDIVLVFDGGACPPKFGKMQVDGLILEVSCMDAAEFRTLEHILSTHYLAYALNAGEILFDPLGMLARLHREVKTRYAERAWVDVRCENFYGRIRQGVQGCEPGKMSLAQIVNGWAFTTALTCFPLLLADLQNCTVRKRYTAARRVLEKYGMGGFYPRLLALLAPERLGREGLAGHMRELEKTFGLACGTSGASAAYPFRRDISVEGAAVAIGGSWELLDSPHPEDAVFWMLATFARCHIIFDMDDPRLGEERVGALWGFLADLGIRCVEDFGRRLDALPGFLPGLRAAAAGIADRREKMA